MSSPQQTMEQKRARAAWDGVLAVKEQQRCVGEYLALVRSAPADVLTSGLGQTLAFLKAKGKCEHENLSNHLSRWVCPEMGWTKNDDLLHKLTERGAGSDVYRRAMAETLAYLVWLKRFAEAELEGGT
jgi:CRISPR-associated protein Cmr5